MKIAEYVVARLASAGARNIFGMPGGGSNLDVIEAARAHGLPFVLSQTETAGALMAAAQAEITGTPGVCLSTLGPGVSSITNGVAHAWLDRVPLVVLTDAMEPAARRQFEHQNLPHGALLRSITKFTADVTATGTGALMDEALAKALGPPPGPVHLDCASTVMCALLEHAEHRTPVAGTPSVQSAGAHASWTPNARRLFEGTRRPLIIAGVGARRTADAAALREVYEDRGLPVLLTYKAKGIVDDRHPSYAGLFTLGDIEKSLVDRADLILTVGLDPVELLPRKWPWTQPVLHCARWPAASGQLPAGESVIGELAHHLHEADDCLPRTCEWTGDEIAAHREHQRAAVMIEGGAFTPGEAVVAIAAAAASARHMTVDAGAHMFPAMALIPADVPGRILISNGLSTMGYALPAAIGAALLDRTQPVVAVTGDAGLLLCLGELLTAAREGLRVVVVVFADGELSLIRIKQARRQLDLAGVRLGAVDWPCAARALGLRAFRSSNAGDLHQHVTEALAGEGPSLIEAQVDPSGYGRMLQTLRG
jgi:acetolactate synthase I/II/III large subunit